MSAGFKALLGLLCCGIVIGFGCSADEPCRSNSDCVAGLLCDVEVGACFAKEVRCEPACADHQQCVSQACSNRYSAVVITSPQDGRGFAPDATVTVTADLALAADRLAKDPGSLILEVTAPGGTKTTQPMAMAGEAYEAAVQLGASGTYELVARYEAAGLSSTKVSVSVDTTGPTLAVTFEPAPTRPGPDGGTTWTDGDSEFAAAFRRDETLKLNVTSTDGDVDGDSVEVTVQFPNSQAMTVPVASQPVDACGTSSGYCGQATVDLSKPEMNAFRADLGVTVNGKDLAGNVAAAAVPSTPVKVTRWKWAHQVDSNPVRASPAVAADGTVIVGSTNSATAGKLVALRPDGTEKWPAKQVGAVVASPAIGASGSIYVASKATGGALLSARSLADGSELATCGPYNGGVIETSPAVMQMPHSGEANSEGAAGVVSGVSGGVLVGVRPGGVAGVTMCPNIASVGGALAGSSIVAVNSDVYFGSGSGKVTSYAYTPGLSPSWGTAPRSGWPVQTSILPHALALSGTDVVGGGGGTGVGGLFAVDVAGGIPWQWTGTDGGVTAWNPSVGFGGRAFIGDDNQQLHALTVRSATSPLTVTLAGIPVGAPVLGIDGLLYLGDSQGTIHARRQDDLSSAWTLALSAADAIEASPNIDCSRSSDGTKIPGAPGVLYVASNSGKLYAFIVDSKGIATDAPWPKYQHDPRNTGNPATDLTAEEFACP